MVSEQLVTANSLQITTLTLALLHSACCWRCRQRFTSLLTSPMWIWWIFNISRISTRRIHFWRTFRKRKPCWIMWSVCFWATLRSSSPARYPLIRTLDEPGDPHTNRSLAIVASAWSRLSGRATPSDSCDTLVLYPTNMVHETIPVEKRVTIRLELYLFVSVFMK